MQSKAAAFQALVAACLVALACAPRDADIRRARVSAERRNLENALDRLEDRLVLNQSRVRFWNEMKGRHESVTAIACASVEEHVASMAQVQLRNGNGPRELARRATLDRARVASVRPAAAEAPAPPPAAPVGAAPAR